MCVYLRRRRDVCVGGKEKILGDDPPGEKRACSAVQVYTVAVAPTIAPNSLPQRAHTRNVRAGRTAMASRAAATTVTIGRPLRWETGGETEEGARVHVRAAYREPVRAETSVGRDNDGRGSAVSSHRQRATRLMRTKCNFFLLVFLPFCYPTASPSPPPRHFVR